MTRTEDAVEIPVSRGVLNGDLMSPADALGLVIFAHGSGSSRFSSRNRSVAAYLRQFGLTTLLFDLLTAEEEQVDAYSREYRFDIPLLAERLIAATRWLIEHRPAQMAPIGYFGSSTGAAAALVAAAALPDNVQAVVSRGGRPDLATDALARVHAPTRLIVGGHDREVLSLNEAALAQMHCETDLVIVPGATHLFEEPGALESVADHAVQWFVRHLAPAA
jgi:pimeloyl-ACP methyl ester carboxylesterase